MRQRDLNRAVARATGETVSLISELGFVPLWPEPFDREPARPRSPHTTPRSTAALRRTQRQTVLR
ncbi:hypothetical protein [Planctomicrobium piriforme]|uniref:Uncharacterized protein n=1 Tax=Planctomicrobium piriforme TaxID=1576369 RepID=A0A1I3P1P0_9PLAN|nr:hypothetical protein [Planctomicrobium piriforme]SFJ15453.1 hypothetical protein SAMN05421753_11611 [Planctomicrobium piriforme]